MPKCNLSKVDLRYCCFSAPRVCELVRIVASRCALRTRREWIFAGANFQSCRRGCWQGFEPTVMRTECHCEALLFILQILNAGRGEISCHSSLPCLLVQQYQVRGVPPETRAVAPSHAALKDEFRGSFLSHSGGVFFHTCGTHESKAVNLPK